MYVCICICKYISMWSTLRRGARRSSGGGGGDGMPHRLRATPCRSSRLLEANLLRQSDYGEIWDFGFSEVVGVRERGAEELRGKSGVG